jgi:hypothetical protein
VSLRKYQVLLVCSGQRRLNEGDRLV